MEGKNVKWVVGADDVNTVTQMQAMRIQENTLEDNFHSLDEAVKAIYKLKREPTILIGSREYLADVRQRCADTALLDGDLVWTVDVSDSNITLQRDDRCEKYAYLIHEKASPVLCEEFGDLEELP